MRILFMGTPEFAVPSLQKLIDVRQRLCAVFTQPDKPKGRGLALTPPPVKVCALKNGVPVWQPKTLRTPEAAGRVRALAPDLIVVAAYGKILPPDILAVPRLGCVNVHASLLPKYRGAAPIQWAVINGEKKAGVTLMKMAEGLDTGDILAQRAVDVGPDETAGELHDRLAALGAGLLSDSLPALEAGRLVSRRQDDAQSSYAPRLTKSLAAVDFSLPARRVHDLCRGLSPWPVAETSLGGRVLRLHKTALCGEKTSAPPGTVVAADGRGVGVACGDGGVLRITVLQQRGGRPMSAAEYLRGHRVEPGAVCRSA